MPVEPPIPSTTPEPDAPSAPQPGQPEMPPPEVSPPGPDIDFPAPGSDPGIAPGQPVA